MYRIIIKNREVFNLKEIVKDDNIKNIEIINAVFLDNFPDAIGLNFFFGWTLSELKSNMSFNK